MDLGEQEVRNFIFRGDDLGMDPAIDKAILAAFKVGGVHEAAFLAVGPSAKQAAASACYANLPVSLHLAYASEWDLVRWSSLTGLLDQTNGFLPAHPIVLEKAPIVDLIAEAKAQAMRTNNLGLTFESFNFHIDCPRVGLATAIEDALGVPCRDIPFGRRPNPAWYTSFFDLSSADTVQKELLLLDFLEKAPAGRHCVVSHPGSDQASLSKLCSKALPDRRLWAVDYRLSDASFLTDIKALKRLGL
ncbi:ChbG/HpnK family deacetylase [Lentilitoribacter sp. EG35]|uniref:ChbG/HpnK family deacetylase n=1 Tax=Lentilitoribacter sp. EG35 TaxID=3234192 RepID=UPI003460F542